MIIELVMATKEVNERARVSSFNLLIALGNRIVELQRCVMLIYFRLNFSLYSEGDDGFSMDSLIQRFVACLALDPHVMSGAILAMSRLLYEVRLITPRVCY